MAAWIKNKSTDFLQCSHYLRFCSSFLYCRRARTQLIKNFSEPQIYQIARVFFNWVDVRLFDSPFEDQYSNIYKHKRLILI